MLAKNTKKLVTKYRKATDTIKKPNFKKILANLANEATKGNSKKVFEAIIAMNVTSSPKIGAVKSDEGEILTGYRCEGKMVRIHEKTSVVGKMIVVQKLLIGRK